MAMEKKSRWMAVLKVVLWLTVLSFAISFIISLFVEDDFESIDGNVAVIEITGTIVAQDGSYLFEDVASSDEIAKLIRKADKNDTIKTILF